jgi:hypothetical protein
MKMIVERRWGKSDKKVSKLTKVDDGSGRRLRPATDSAANRLSKFQAT